MADDFVGQLHELLIVGLEQSKRLLHFDPTSKNRYPSLPTPEETQRQILKNQMVIMEVLQSLLPPMGAE